MNLIPQNSLNGELANVNTSTQTKQGIKMITCLQIAYIPKVYVLLTHYQNTPTFLGHARDYCDCYQVSSSH